MSLCREDVHCTPGSCLIWYHPGTVCHMVGVTHVLILNSVCHVIMHRGKESWLYPPPLLLQLVDTCLIRTGSVTWVESYMWSSFTATIICRHSMMSYNRLGVPPPPICIGRILQLRSPLMSYIYSALYAERWQRSTSAKDELICGCTSPFQEPHPRSNMIGLAIDTSTTASTTTTSTTMAKLCTPWANNTLDLKIQMFCCMQ